MAPSPLEIKPKGLIEDTASPTLDNREASFAWAPATAESTGVVSSPKRPPRALEINPIGETDFTTSQVLSNKELAEADASEADLWATASAATGSGAESSPKMAPIPLEINPNGVREATALPTLDNKDCSCASAPSTA